jgi:hypothetical protein
VQCWRARVRWDEELVETDLGKGVVVGKNATTRWEGETRA